MAEEASRFLQDQILKTRIPDKLARAIREEANRLEKRNPDCLLALRSSALGEDGTLSYAGQYTTLLGVSTRRVLPGYLEVIASLFAQGAMKYRRHNGLPPAGGAMAVGCLCLVDARSAGVLYTLDPVQPQRDLMRVTAVHGLGKTVVEGTGETDQFVVTRGRPQGVVSRALGRKRSRYVVAGGEGVTLAEADDDQACLPALKDEELAELADTALRIERYMKCAQDIEWAFDRQGRLFILQTRPLRIDDKSVSEQPSAGEVGGEHTVLMRGLGEVACRGIAFGRVVLFDDSTSIERLPDNAVLVARYSRPSLAAALPGASAVITDIGTATGHLATVAREFRIPAVVDTGIATRTLRDGQEVTVDAEENVIYLGQVKELLHRHLLSDATYQDKSEFRSLRRLLRKVAPLHLKDPQSPRFAPGNCSTYHDIIRFAHEKAVEELVRGYSIKSSRRSRSVYRLDLPIPLDLVLVDLGGGLHPGAAPPTVEISQVTSRPLLDLLDGLGSEGVWNSEPADMDLNGFMASATRSQTLTGPLAAAPQQNLALIDANYLNLNLKLGYHFNIVDCYLAEKRNDNFIYFRFAGGVTEMTRRSRRAAVLQQILEKYDFMVDRKEDLVIGRIKKISAEAMTERLRMIGRLIGFTRQLDVYMRDESLVIQLVNGFLNGNYHTASCIEEVSGKRGIEMKNSQKVLVLDDEEIVCERVKGYLEKNGYQVETFTESSPAMERLQQERFDVVVTDLKMKGPTGLDVLHFVRRQGQGTQVIMITGYATMDASREAEYGDVFDFICKPFQMDDLGTAVKKAAKKARKLRG
jgi:pyruvate,water dikinase